MNSFAYHENKPRGTYGFPIEYHFLDKRHPKYIMPFHWHLEYEILLIKQGEFNLRINNEVINIKSGEVAFISEGDLHGGEPCNCIYDCIVFNLEQIINDNPLLKSKCKDILNNHTIKTHFSSGDKLTKIVIDIFNVINNKEEGFEISVIGLLWQMVGNILSEKKYIKNIFSGRHNERTEQIKKVLFHIREEYNNPLTLNYLSEIANLSPRYFCRIFNQLIGKTPIEYLNYYRIECACNMFYSSGINVTEVAFACGFNDLSYFIKTFKKIKGMTPKKFLSQQKK